MKKFVGIILIVLLLVMSNKTFSQLKVLEDGEELYYEVYYSFINIGWVKFNTEKVIGKKDTYQCTAQLKSNDAIPFVDVNYQFKDQIEIRDNQLKPIFFESHEWKEGKESVLLYKFNYDSNFVDISKKGFNGENEYNKRMNLYSIYQDGLSIFYFARYDFINKHSKDIPVLINQDSASVRLNYNVNKTEAEIGNIEYDISSFLLDGNTNYKLVFGLTGNFQGWFSNDMTRIPLKAKFNVQIGNVTLELKSWKRSDWTPPKF